MATVVSDVKFDGSVTRRRSLSELVRASHGLKVERFIKRNDLCETKKDGTKTKPYGAVVPVIGGVERIDLRCYYFELDTDFVTDFNVEGGLARQLKVDDEWHTYCKQQLGANDSIDAWLDKVVANFSTSFPNGLIIAPFEYLAKTKSGGTWWNALFAGKKA